MHCRQLYKKDKKTFNIKPGIILNLIISLVMPVCLLFCFDWDENLNKLWAHFSRSNWIMEPWWLWRSSTALQLYIYSTLPLESCIFKIIGGKVKLFSQSPTEIHPLNVKKFIPNAFLSFIAPLISSKGDVYLKAYRKSNIYVRTLNCTRCWCYLCKKTQLRIRSQYHVDSDKK